MKRHIPKWGWAVGGLLICLGVVFVVGYEWFGNSQRAVSTVWHEIAQTRSHEFFGLGQFLTTRWPAKSLNYQIAGSVANPTMKSNSGSILLPFVATWSIDGSFQYEQLTGQGSIDLMLDITYISGTNTLATYQITAPMTLVRSAKHLWIQPAKTIVNRSGMVIEDLIVGTALINEFADKWIHIPLQHNNPSIILPLFALVNEQPNRHLRTTNAGGYVMSIEGDGLLFSGQLDNRDSFIGSFFLPTLGNLTLFEEDKNSYTFRLGISSLSGVSMEGDLQYTRGWDHIVYKRKGNGIWGNDGLWAITDGSSTIKKRSSLEDISLPEQSIERRTLEKSLFPSAFTTGSLITVTEALTP